MKSLDRTIEYLPQNEQLRDWVLMGDSERMLWGVVAIMFVLSTSYIIKSIRDEGSDVVKFIVDRLGYFKRRKYYMSLPAFTAKTSDGFGPVEADGYRYDAFGVSEGGFKRTGLDDAGYRRNGFSDFGFHRRNGLKYSPTTGLDAEGLDLNGTRPASPRDMSMH